MAEESWFRRARAAIEREYERRLRRASNVASSHSAHHEPAAPEHETGDPEVAAVVATEEAASEEGVIVNLPRGKRF